MRSWYRKTLNSLPLYLDKHCMSWNTAEVQCCLQELAILTETEARLTCVKHYSYLVILLAVSLTSLLRWRLGMQSSAHHLIHFAPLQSLQIFLNHFSAFFFSPQNWRGCSPKQRVWLLQGTFFFPGNTEHPSFQKGRITSDSAYVR